jgi:hypothetical protein
MENTALVLANNLSHNVLAHIETAKTSLNRGSSRYRCHPEYGMRHKESIQRAQVKKCQSWVTTKG